MASKVKLTGKYGALALKMLRHVCEFLDNESIEYVLEAGTLLGIIRENRLLPWDNDLDITITDNFVEQLLRIKWKLRLKGYRTRIRRYKKDTGPFKKGDIRIIKIQTTKFLFFKDQSLMDIFVKKGIKDDYYWTVSEKKPVLKWTPRRFYDQHTRYRFDGYDYSVPEDYIGYLAYHYGDNWRTPIKNWNFRTDDNCKKEIL